MAGNGKKLPKRLALLARVGVIASAALHISVGFVYQLMNPDGVSYLDVADAYLRRDWSMAISPVWSPLYSWLLAPVLAFVPRSITWDFRVVHLFNFAIFLATFAAFEFFWAQLTTYVRGRSIGGEAEIALPEWAWPVVGYALFAWAFLVVVDLTEVTPDVLMASFVFLAAGVLVRVRLGRTAARDFVWLGAILGVGYLAKGVMFPLGWIALGVALTGIRGARRLLKRGALAALVFMLISGPFIAVISLSKGRLTIGEAGRLGYLRFVNHVPYPHWQGSPENGQLLAHPSRRILEAPAIYEFGTPLRATYPISYDPSYWYEGGKPRRDWAAHVKLVWTHLSWYGDFFLRQQAVLVLAVAVLYGAGVRRRVRAIDLVQKWGLAVLACAALTLYAFILVEKRYIAVFTLLLWAELLSNVRLVNSTAMKRMALVLSSAVLAWLLFTIGAANVSAFRATFIYLRTPPGQRSVLLSSWPTEVAEELGRLGVRPGSKVAVIGEAFYSYWARLARVQIVAEMFGWEAESFWNNAAIRAQALRAFADTGAIAIVAEDIYTNSPLTDWHRVGASHHYIYLLSPKVARHDPVRTDP